MKSRDGIVVLSVTPGSATERAGLQGLGRSEDGQWVLGDVITALSGKPLKTVAQLMRQLDDLRVGDVVDLTVLRNGKTRNVPVELEASR